MPTLLSGRRRTTLPAALRKFQAVDGYDRATFGQSSRRNRQDRPADPRSLDRTVGGGASHRRRQRRSAGRPIARSGRHARPRSCGGSRSARRGRFPTAVLVRMWRELLAAHTRLQAPLSVAVFARQEDAQRIWDLARDHFGSATPMTQVDRPIQALRALGDGSATVAVLPLPGDDESWWVALMSDQDPRLRVFARLPFVTGSCRRRRRGERVRHRRAGCGGERRRSDPARDRGGAEPVPRPACAISWSRPGSSPAGPPPGGRRARRRRCIWSRSTASWATATGGSRTCARRLGGRSCASCRSAATLDR